MVINQCLSVTRLKEGRIVPISVASPQYTLPTHTLEVFVGDKTVYFQMVKYIIFAFFSEGNAEVELFFPEAVKSVLATQDDLRCSILLYSEATRVLKTLMNVCCVKVSRLLYNPQNQGVGRYNDIRRTHISELLTSGINY